MKVILRLQTNTIVSEIPLDSNTSIVFGRSSKSDHKIPDEHISSSHCKISLRPPKLELIDLESKNGTYLNGLRVEQADIFLGDEIKIGETKITILTEKMYQNSINALTFPGVAKDRVSHGLQLDFTGARMINQGHGGLQITEKKPTASANKELEVRKKAQSKIKLSKQEVKLRNKKASSLASTFDMIFTVLAVAFPLVISNSVFLMNPSLFQDQRLLVMLISVIVFMTLFFIVNQKILKFTFGEKLAGIQKLYENQD